MPPQPDPHDTLDGGCAQTTEWESRDWGCSRVRDEDRQKELNRVRVHSKSRKHSKSHRRSKSRKRSKSHGHDEAEMRAGMRCGNLESGHPNVGGRNPAGPLATP